MDPDAQRAALMRLIEAQGVTLSDLSRVLGRNPAYLQQYVRRGSPRLLGEEDRARLARYLGVPESVLGGPQPSALVEVARLDIGASAGPGRLAGEERARATLAFAPALLRMIGVRPEAASVIRVEGDSMAPTLADGDDILVDRDRREPGSRPAIFVVRVDGEILVKRLRSAVGAIELVSDNPAYPVRRCRRDAVEVIGRVAWLGRALP